MSRTLLLTLPAAALLALLPPAGRADQPVQPKLPVPAIKPAKPPVPATPVQLGALQLQCQRLSALIESRKIELNNLEIRLKDMQDQLTKLQKEIKHSAAKPNDGCGREEIQEDAEKSIPPEVEKRLREMEK